MDRVSRYLSPEPLHQDLGWVKDQALEGFSTPTYAYARNNPLRCTDPTGLFSWRRECSARDPLGIIQRGFVASKFASPLNHNLQITTNSGTVGFDTENSDVCADCVVAKNIKRGAKANGSNIAVQIAFDEAEDCWDALTKEICDMCKRGPPPVQKKTLGKPAVCR